MRQRRSIQAHRTTRLFVLAEPGHIADECVYVLAGKVVLVTDQGEEVMRDGDFAGFKAGVQNGHCLQNRSGVAAGILVIGSCSEEDHGEYSGIDMVFKPGRHSGNGGYEHEGGTDYRESQTGFRQSKCTAAARILLNRDPPEFVHDPVRSANVQV